MPGNTGMPGAGPMEGATGTVAESAAPQVVGETPSDWQAQPLSTMRQASFLVKGDKGAEADISLITLSGTAGGVLENVNRWLSQIGQPPVTEEQMNKMARHVHSSLGDVLLVDLKGLPDGGDPVKDGRIIGGISSDMGKTCFFKMRGNEELVEAQKKNFIKWIETVSLVASEAPMAPMQAGMPADHPAIPGSAPETAEKKLKWDVPSGWKTAPLTAMRYASFAIEGKKGEKADVSVVDLPGEAGSDFDNVNRWRGQIGLPPVEESGLASVIVKVKGKNGEFLTADMMGTSSHIVAAWIRLDGHTWFFKLSGPDKLVADEKGKFTKFLQSVQFHP